MVKTDTPNQRILNHCKRGSSSVRMTYIFACLDRLKLFLFIKQYFFGQASKTGGQPYSDTHPYVVSEYSLTYPLLNLSPLNHWQKSFMTFGLGSSSQHLVANWKKYPHKFHWQRDYLALAMVVRLDRSKLNAIAKAKKPLCQWDLLEILCCRFAH